MECAREPHGSSTHSLRSGFTLVEVIVAIVLVAVGLLALSAASAVAVDQLGDLDRQRRATEFAESRAESLAVQPCTAARTGSATPELGMTEWWSAGAPAGSAREIVDSIEFPRGRFTGDVVIHTLGLC